MTPETAARQTGTNNPPIQFSDEMPLLTGMQIFRAGDYTAKKKGKWTPQDLKEIQAHFAMLKQADEHVPPLKSSHEDDNRGNPVLGWAEKVYAVGQDLFADFRLVSNKVMDLIKRKAFRFRSAELHDQPRPWTRPDGSRLANVLRAVSFVPIPEVKGMEEITATLSDSSLAYIAMGSDDEPAVVINFQGDMNMPEETAEQKKAREEKETAAATKLAADDKAAKLADEAAANKAAEDAAAAKAADDAAAAKAAGDAAAKAADEAAAAKAADEKKKAAFSAGPVTISGAVEFSAEDMEATLDNMPLPELKRLATEQAKVGHQAAFKDSASWIDDHIKCGDILPKLREIALALDNPNLRGVAKVACGEGQEPLTVPELFRMYVEGSPAAVKMGETAGQNGANSGQEAGVKMDDGEADSYSDRVMCGKSKDEWAALSSEDKATLVKTASGK